MIKLLIVDDHEMVRLGLASYFSILKDIDLIAEAEDGLEGFEKALEYQPDIILMDLVMDVMDGIESTKKILKKWPEAKIIILTSFVDDEKVYPAMEAGASSYLLKTSSASEIAEAIRKTHLGEEVIEEEVSKKLSSKNQYSEERKLYEDLTKREIEVLLLVAEGLTNQKIADTLFITIKT
ncbi:MAG: response regulator transcription factor, partial [Atopostipes sp.]|nr:response regulator transcription factor [Atopostipes sp.]